jgi:hypothetical protein
MAACPSWAVFRPTTHPLSPVGSADVRLEDGNWRPILNTVVDRTKIQITLAKEEEK